MSIRKRAMFFAFAGVLTFLLGAWLTRVSPVPRQRQLSPWEVLLSFENQDLESLSEASQRDVSLAVKAVTGQRDEGKSHSFIPVLFRSISNTAGERRYLLVEEKDVVIIPDESRMRVHVFDTNGRLLSMDDFSTGWRTTLVAFRVRNVVDLSSETLIVDTEYCLGGSPAHQFYALIGNRIELIELQQGITSGRNIYLNSRQSVGPQINRSADEWEKALYSPHPAEVMSALIWLHGQHWNSKPEPYDANNANAATVSALRSRSGVQNRINELSKSGNFWISAAADAVLHQDQ